MVTLNVRLYNLQHTITCKLLNEFHDDIFHRKMDKKLNFHLIMSIPYLDVAELATIQSERTE